jgi:hypothetical protein
MLMVCELETAMPRRITFDRIERFVFRLIFVVLILIEGYKFICFVANSNEAPTTPQIQQPKNGESPAIDAPIFRGVLKRGLVHSNQRNWGRLL